MRLLLTGLILNTVAMSASGAESLASCRSLLENEARLHCYDRLPDGVNDSDEQAQDAATSEAASVAEPNTSVPTQTVADQELDSAASEQRFGFEFAVKDALQEISSLVVAVRKNARGGQVLTLENEQMWQQANKQFKE